MYPQLKEKIKSAVGKSAEGGCNVAIPFSAGLDSSLIARIIGKRKNAMLITVGTADSDDVKWSEKYSSQIGTRHEVCRISDEEIISIYRKLSALGFDFLACDILISFCKACEIAKENGCAKVVCGAGAEEVFIGYKKYVDEIKKGGKTVSQIRKDAIAFWHSEKGDGAKIRKVAEEFGLEVAFPFLDKEVVEAAGKIADEKHLPKEDGLSKPALREAAKELGVPIEIVLRPKKAMQYGSGVHKKLIEMKKKGEI